jgi:hypothetical protein
LASALVAALVMVTEVASQVVMEVEMVTAVTAA